MCHSHSGWFIWSRGKFTKQWCKVKFLRLANTCQPADRTRKRRKKKKLRFSHWRGLDRHETLWNWLVRQVESSALCQLAIVPFWGLGVLLWPSFGEELAEWKRKGIPGSRLGVARAHPRPPHSRSDHVRALHRSRALSPWHAESHQLPRSVVWKG